MSKDRRHRPTRSGAGSSWSSPAPALDPVSPLPRPPEPHVPAELHVPAGTYGMSGAFVPTTAYVPPLPPGIDDDTPASALRVVPEDPLAFLAAQAASHDRAVGPSAPEASPEPARRFRPAAERDAVPVATPPRRTSVPPPGFR